MREIDLYVNLIDENEANRILYEFHASLKSNNFQLKKTKIAKILKGLNLKVSGRPIENPFYFVINQHRREEYQSLNEKQFFTIMCSHYVMIPPYKKLANALIYFPDETKELIPRMEENIKNGEDVFNLGYDLKTDDDVIKFIQLTSALSNNESISKFIADIEKYMDDSEKKQLKEMQSDINNWTMVDLYNNISSNDTNFPKYLIIYSFLNTHQMLQKDIRILFLIETLETMMENNYNLYNSLKGKYDLIAADSENGQKDITELGKSGKEIQELKDSIAKSKKENNKYKEKIKQVNEEIKQKNDEIKNYDKTFKELENKMKLLKEESQKEIEITKKAYEERMNASVQKTSYMENYINYNFKSEENSKYMFILVHAGEAKIAKIIYPEVLFTNIGSIEDDLKKKCTDNIKELYIQRQNLSWPQIEQIKKYAKIYKLEYKIINPLGEKELIEEIAKIKNDRRN